MEWYGLRGDAARLCGDERLGADQMAWGRHRFVVARYCAVIAACLAACAPLCAQFGLAVFDPPPLVASLPGAANEEAAQNNSTDDDSKQRGDNEQERLGEEPPDSSIDVFRQSNVLLPKGMLEVEWGFQYALFEDNFLTILPDASIAPQLTSSRTMLGSLSLRYGYTERFQPYLTVPGGMTTVETAHSLEDFSNNEYGIGDVTFGTSILLRDGQDKRSDLVLGITGIAPTGEANFLSIVPGNASLGNGFWIVSPSLTWTWTYDPVVMYATTAYVHRFEREFFGLSVRPGEEFDIGYGAGFAINDELTYSLQFQWAHQFDTAIDGVEIADSGADVATIRQSAIIRLAPQKFLEVFFANGMTSNSPEISAGALWVRRY